MSDRRQFLKSVVSGALPLWAASRMLSAQQPAVGARFLAIDGGGSNVLCFNTGGALVLVDSGAPKSGDHVMAAIKTFGGDAKIEILFNTHYHIDQTSNNERVAAAGAKIIAHEHTRQWM